LKKSTTISKRPLEPKNLDYDFLFNEAIRYLQQLSGDIWTDYNIHDPGVTILEYLCYAITDLGYRTSLDIKDLLNAKEKDEISIEIKDTLFSPQTIFPSAPLTISDYRKLLIDRLFEIENCWVEVDQPINGQKGLYHVYLKLHDLQIYQRKKDDIADRARKILMANRNLGEDFSKIQFLEKQKIAVDAKLIIRYNANAEDVMIEIFTILDEFFNTAINHYPRRKVLDLGKSVENVFDGPFLENGYIDDQELKDRSKMIHIDQVREVLSDIDSVLTVSEIRFRKNGKVIDEESISFERDEYPAFDKDFLSEPLERLPIILEKQGKASLVDVKKVKRICNSKLNKPAQRLTADQSLSPKEFHSNLYLKDLAYYTSIQNFFPHIYGITKWGTPARAPMEVKKKAKQLKGYLLLFEHFFSTYLVGLTELRYLFSSEAKTPETKYNLFPFDVPDVDALIKKDDEGDAREKVEMQLRKLNLEFSLPLKKKNEILDHLLARFNEEFPEEILMYKPGKDHITSFSITLEELIRAKAKFLQDYPTLSRNRGVGFDYTVMARLNENVSGLKKRICLQLGISNYNNKSLTQPLKQGVRLKKEDVNEALSQEAKETNNDEGQDEFRVPITDLMVYGIEKSNYTISGGPDGVKKVYFFHLEEQISIISLYINLTVRKNVKKPLKNYF
jgi:hypothetical protein